MTFLQAFINILMALNEFNQPANQPTPCRWNTTNKKPTTFLHCWVNSTQSVLWKPVFLRFIKMCKCSILFDTASHKVVIRTRLSSFSTIRLFSLTKPKGNLWHGTVIELYVRQISTAWRNWFLFFSSKNSSVTILKLLDQQQKLEEMQ
jgi:hypothetical protein